MRRAATASSLAPASAPAPASASASASALSLLLLVGLLAGAVGRSHAADERIPYGVLSNGAGVASDGTLRLRGTLGQSAPGATSGVEAGGLIGFWYLAVGGGRTIVPVPLALLLGIPTPNPFRETTALAFALPEAGTVKIAVYDLAGRQIRTLLDEVLPAGPHQTAWDGRDASGRHVAAGVYYCRLETATGEASRKIARIE